MECFVFFDPPLAIYIAKYTNTFTLTYLNVIAEYHRITGKFGERKFGELIDQLIDY